MDYIPIFPFVAFCLYRYINNERLLVFSMGLLLVSMLVWLFFAFKIFKFYKEIESNTLSSFQHLLELDYQMKYYRDLYQSYYIAFVPILLCEIFLIIEFNPGFNHINFSTFLISMIIILLFSFVILYICWLGWYSYFYGRHIKKIKGLISKIKE